MLLGDPLRAAAYGEGGVGRVGGWVEERGDANTGARWVDGARSARLSPYAPSMADARRAANRLSREAWIWAGEGSATGGDGWRGGEEGVGTAPAPSTHPQHALG